MSSRSIVSRNVRVTHFTGSNSVVNENLRLASFRDRARNAKRETGLLQGQRQAAKQRHKNLLSVAESRHRADIAARDEKAILLFEKSYLNIQEVEERFVGEFDLLRTEIQGVHVLLDTQLEAQQRTNYAHEETKRELKETKNELETLKIAQKKTRDELQAQNLANERSNARNREETNDKFANLEEMIKGMMSKRTVDVGTGPDEHSDLDLDGTATGLRSSMMPPVGQ